MIVIAVRVATPILAARDNGGDDLTTDSKSAGGRFLWKKWNLQKWMDHTLVVSLLGIVVFVLAFSLGVERGKAIASEKLINVAPLNGVIAKVSNQTKDISTEVVVSQLSESPSASSEQVEAQVPSHAEGEDVALVESGADATAAEPAPSVVDLPESFYTIQMVTYVDSGRAQKQVMRLKEIGHEGFVVPSGRYYQVCIDQFKARSQAIEVTI